MLTDKRNLHTKKFKDQQRFKELPDEIKALMQFSKWLTWDYQETKNRESLNRYYHARTWLQLYMLEIGLKENIAPKVNYKNYMKIYYDLKDVLDLVTLAAMQDTDYKFIKTYRGYAMVKMSEKGEIL